MNGTCLFVSPHAPTDDQTKIAELLGYTLVPVVDCDVCCQNDMDLLLGKYLDSNTAAVSCVYPLFAIEGLRFGLRVLNFENANRAPVGEKPDFRCCGVSVISDKLEIVQYRYNGEELLASSFTR